MVFSALILLPKEPVKTNVQIIRLFKAILVLSSILWTGVTKSEPSSDPWGQASSGKGSFYDLGPDFSVIVPLAPAKGARLVLFNKNFAEFLGLNVTDQNELVEKLKEAFALMVSKERESGRTGFSTYYSDSNPESENYNVKDGDGRVVWVGEILIKNQNDFSIFDVVLKGAGPTPLALELKKDKNGRINPLALQYGDGLQTMSEAIRSFVASEALLGNDIESTVDLAVFELPLLKRNPLSGKMEKAALTVRVGQQVRLAHLNYHKKGTPQHRKLVEFVIRRGLHLEQSSEVDMEMASQFLNKFIPRVAEMAARYQDAGFFHGSLTDSNMGISGFPFDFGTFVAMDIFQPEFGSDALKDFYAKDQWKFFARKIIKMMSHIGGAGLLQRQGNSAQEAFFRFLDFYTTFRMVLALKRLGLEEVDIMKNFEALKEQVVDFWEALESLESELSVKKVNFFGRLIHPAKYDTNRILKGSFEAALSKNEDQDQAWHKLFNMEHNWAVPSEINLRSEKIKNYISAVSHLAAKLIALGFDIKVLAKRASEVGRPGAIGGLFPNYSKLLSEIQGQSFFEIFKRPKDVKDYERFSEAALDLSRQLIDQRFDTKQCREILEG